MYVNVSDKITTEHYFGDKKILNVNNLLFNHFQDTLIFQVDYSKLISFRFHTICEKPIFKKNPYFFLNTNIRDTGRYQIWRLE